MHNAWMRLVYSFSVAVLPPKNPFLLDSAIQLLWLLFRRFSLQVMLLLLLYYAVVLKKMLSASVMQCSKKRRGVMCGGG